MPTLDAQSITSSALANAMLVGRAEGHKPVLIARQMIGDCVKAIVHIEADDGKQVMSELFALAEAIALDKFDFGPPNALDTRGPRELPRGWTIERQSDGTWAAFEGGGFRVKSETFEAAHAAAIRIAYDTRNPPPA